MLSKGRLKPFLASVVLLLAVNAGFGHSVKKLICVEGLRTRAGEITREQLGAWFNRYDMEPLQNSDGFRLRLKPGEMKLGTRTVEVPFEIDTLDILRKKVWKDGTQKFEFINVGYKNFEVDSQNVNRAVLKHIITAPNKDLVVLFDPERAYVESVLSTHRWTIHNAVLEKYAERKDYLTARDFDALTYINTISGNSDVFALLQYDRSSILHYNNSLAIKSRLLMTAQITYFGDRNYFRPSLRGLEIATGMVPNKTFDMLPFEFRIEPDKLYNFRQDFYRRFVDVETAEIIRCASFDQEFSIPSRISRAVRDRFFLNLFLTGKARGVRNFVISVDPVTARLFREYGFELYSELPIFNRGRPRADETKEYLYFLDLQSREAQAIYIKLVKASEGVIETVEDI